MILRYQSSCVFIFFCATHILTRAQERKPIQIHVFKNILDVTKRASVGNTTTKKEGVLENDYIIINVNAGDQLVVAAPECEMKTFTLTINDLSKDSLEIHLNPVAIELDEVEVQQFKPPVFLDHEIPDYTMAERRLMTANGRGKKLKDAIEIEKKEHLIDFIITSYKSFILNEILEDQDDLMLFIYYIVEGPTGEDILYINEEAKAEFFLLNQYESFMKSKIDDDE
ncbi:hypothetical protein ACG2LH_11125 [Zhouia sp. PK063]|uniref:hypothetical protein n=1 Tax=Zhouia sp. PK063 TaxID=3373602 RepID=UPI003789C4D0